MSKILVLFSTREGQTEGIAERIAFRLTKLGHEATVLSADSPDASRSIDEADAVIVGGAIHYGRFDPVLADLVRRNAPVLLSRPNAFYSVSLSAATDCADAHAVMAAFQSENGWIANDAAVFAGALRYSRYSPIKRFVMKLVARANGGQTDTSRDYEFTDWRAVDRFAAAFALRIATPLAA
jgi:menaquinone-dependent protoporphyrinogen oxidase